MDKSVKIKVVVRKVYCCRKENVNVFRNRMKGGEGEKKKKTKSRPT